MPAAPTSRAPDNTPAADAAAGAPRDAYLANLGALYRAEPRLALALDELPAAASLALEPTRAGPPTAAVALPDGRRLYLHSRYEPLDEARQLCRALDDDATGPTGDSMHNAAAEAGTRPPDPAQSPDGEKASGIWAVVLCGLGLGHHLAPLRARLGPEGVLIVAEPDLLTIRTALSLYDVSDDLLAGRIVILHSTDKAELHRKLDPSAALLMLGLRFVVPPPYRQLHAAFFNEVRRLITDYAAYTRMSLVTLVANARITAANVANNLPWYVATPPIDELRNRFRGKPAVVVAAGPSLGRNVEQLRGVGDRAVVIAVQTALKPLLARGIRPNFVTSLDFSDLSKRFFENVDLSGVELIAEPKASWQVLDTFFGGEPGAFADCADGHAGSCGAGVPARPGEHGGSPHDPNRPPRAARLLNNDFAARCVGTALAQRAGLRAGSTVAHLSFYLAEYLGCDPIILVGQDLGFSGGVYYTPGVAMHDAWRPELGTFCSLEQKEWERIVRARPILHRAIDVHGAPIYTDEQMFTYLQQFERDFAASAATVIDATEGGVAKRGARPMKLADALREFASVGCVPDAPVIDGSWGSTDAAPSPAESATLTPTLSLQGRGGQTATATPTRTLQGNGNPDNATTPAPAGRVRLDPARLNSAADELRKRLDDLAEFQKLCEETRDLLTEMTGLLDRPSEFDRRIVRVDELRALVEQRHTIFRMVSDVAQLAELQKFSADRRLAMDKSRAAAGTTEPKAAPATASVGGESSRANERRPGGRGADETGARFELPPAERARRQLQRDSRFVDALLEGCDVLRRILSDARGRTEALQRELLGGAAILPAKDGPQSL